MPLFHLGNFVLHSGASSRVKIDCGALTSEDWQAAALLAHRLVGPFGSVEGIPEGGLRFASALEPFITQGPHLIVDDVLTTGASLQDARREAHRRRGSPAWVEPGWCRGVVLFARGPLPPWAQAIHPWPPQLWEV